VVFLAKNFGILWQVLGQRKNSGIPERCQPSF